MSPYSGYKCSEEEALDLFYLEIEERILLLISEGEEEEEEEEDRVKKTEGAPLLLLNSSIKQLQPTKQERRGYYGRENIGKKNKLWIHEYGARNNGGKIVTEMGGRRGTGVFIPKSVVHSC